MAPELKPGDTVRLKKPHPCGGRHWRVQHAGADNIGLLCRTCGHYVTAPHFRLARRIRAVIRPAPTAPAPTPPTAADRAPAAS